MRIRRLPVAVMFALLFAAPGTPARGGESLPALPKAGEWFEYVVAYPLDPMENAIRGIIGLAKPTTTATPGSTLAMTPATADGVAVEMPPPNPTEPAFDPEPVWFAMPLRLEILRVEHQGCRAMLAYAGLRHEVFLPLPRRDEAVSGDEVALPSPAAATPAVEGDNPDEETELGKDLDYMFRRESFVGEIEQAENLETTPGRHWVGDTSIEVAIETNPDPELGFTRLVSPEAPFGLARFATRHVDFALVARGIGIAPEFPVPDALIDPPPGKLHLRTF